jgi:hypothetical protein
LVTDVFLICPVRNVSSSELNHIADYVAKLEAAGQTVYWPNRDTVQTGDPVGNRICGDNREAICNCREVHIWYSGSSQGSLFDLGMAFAYAKPLVLVNRGNVPATECKSFNNLMLWWDVESIKLERQSLIRDAVS